MEEKIEQYTAEEDGEIIDVDKMDGGTLKSAKGRGIYSAMGGVSEGRAPTAASKF